MRNITDVVIRARDGDRAAIAELVEATIADVHRFCGALVDRDSADDLTQQTYLKAIESLSRYRGDAPAHVWLLSIARHACVDEIRRRQRRRELERVSLAVGPLHHTNPDDRIDLDRALAAIDVERREAFVLTQALGMSYQEAADAVGCPVGTIRSRVFRARNELVALMTMAAAETSTGA